MRLRNWQKNALLAVGSCAACLVLGEVVVRLVWQPGGQQSVIRADPFYGWSLRPGAFQHSVHTDRGLDYRIHVNALGLRDRERQRAKPEHVQRVLFLGDSVVFGAGVEEGERCSDVLEDHLGSDVEVWNAGVSGWGTDQEFLFLCRDGFSFHPDVVVLGLCMLNDVLNNMLPHELFGGSPKPRFVLDDDGQLVLQPPAPRPTPSLRRRVLDVLKRSRLLHFMGRRARLLHAPAPRPARRHAYYPEDLESDHSHWAVYRVPYTERFEAAYRVTEALLGAMRDSCAAHGVPLVWFAFPNKVEVDSAACARELEHYAYDPSQFDLTVPYARLASAAARLAVLYRYPLDDFKNARGPLYFEHDGHPNAAGQAVAASALAPVVRAALDASHRASR